MGGEVQATVGEAGRGTVGRGGLSVGEVSSLTPTLRPTLLPTVHKQRAVGEGRGAGGTMDAACPISTGRGTRRVRLVRGKDEDAK